MINLLPPERKKQIKAGRTNTLLLRYNLLLLTAAVLLFGASSATYFYMSATKARAEATIKDNDAMINQPIYKSTASQAAEFRTNLTVAKQILDSQVIYSNVILKIATIVPKDVVLTSLNLDSKTFGTSSTFQAAAKSPAAVIELKRKFQESPLFQNVYFQTINYDPETDGPYKYIIVFSATLNKQEALK